MAPSTKNVHLMKRIGGLRTLPASGLSAPLPPRPPCSRTHPVKAGCCWPAGLPTPPPSPRPQPLQEGVPAAAHQPGRPQPGAARGHRPAHLRELPGAGRDGLLRRHGVPPQHQELHAAGGQQHGGRAWPWPWPRPGRGRGRGLAVAEAWPWHAWPGLGGRAMGGGRGGGGSAAAVPRLCAGSWVCGGSAPQRVRHSTRQRQAALACRWQRPAHVHPCPCPCRPLQASQPTAPRRQLQPAPPSPIRAHTHASAASPCAGGRPDRHRQGGRVHLRPHLQRRAGQPAAALGARHAGDGQQRAAHQRQPVLCHLQVGQPPQLQAHRVWQVGRGQGRGRGAGGGGGARGARGAGRGAGGAGRGQGASLRIA
jgi:hypothetical protein